MPKRKYKYYQKDSPLEYGIEYSCYGCVRNARDVGDYDCEPTVWKGPTETVNNEEQMRLIRNGKRSDIETINLLQNESWYGIQKLLKVNLKNYEKYISTCRKCDKQVLPTYYLREVWGTHTDLACDCYLFKKNDYTKYNSKRTAVLKLNIECPGKGLGLWMPSSEQDYIGFEIEISTSVPDEKCKLTRSAKFTTGVTPKTLSSYKENTLIYASKEDSRYPKLRKSYHHDILGDPEGDELDYQQVVNKW